MSYVETDFGLSADSIAALENRLIALGLAERTTERLKPVSGVSFTKPAPLMEPTGQAVTDEDGFDVPVMQERYAAFTSARLHKGGDIPSDAIAIWDDSNIPTGLPNFGPRTPAPPLDGLKADAKAKVLEWATSFGRRFTDQYPDAEVASWPAKIAEARAYLADTTSTVTMLRTEANALGVTVDDLADRVVAKGEIYERAQALIAATRQKTQTAIDAAQNALEIDQILYDALA
ncbi:MAG: hypothetical protein AAFR27_10390, partial [Pseudomonadota bacterium]